MCFDQKFTACFNKRGSSYYPALERLQAGRRDRVDFFVWPALLFDDGGSYQFGFFEAGQLWIDLAELCLAEKEGFWFFHLTGDVIAGQWDADHQYEEGV